MRTTVDGNPMCVQLCRYSSIGDTLISPVYPFEIVQFGITVPEALPYSGFAAYVQAFSTHTLLSVSITAVAVIILFLVLFRWKRQRKFLFFASVADVLNLLMNDNAYIRYHRLSDIEVLMIVPLTFTGLIFTNFILSILTSYLTSPIVQPQINTVEDIYNSSLYVYTWGDSWTKLTTRVLSNRFENGNWTERVRTMDVSISEQIMTFNASITFLQNLKFSRLFSSIQQRLNIRGFELLKCVKNKFF